MFGDFPINNWVSPAHSKLITVKWLILKTHRTYLVGQWEKLPSSSDWNCKISKSPKCRFASRWEGIVLMGNNKDLKVAHKKGLIVRGSDLLQFILWWERNFLLFSAGHLFQERTICNLAQEIGALQRIWNLGLRQEVAGLNNQFKLSLPLNIDNLAFSATGPQKEKRKKKVWYIDWHLPLNP